MKNVSKLFGVIVLAAVIGFSISTCSNDSTGDDPLSLEGVWTASGGRVITFTGKTFAYTVNEAPTYSGTFTLFGLNITFDVSQQQEPAYASFQISEKTLTLSKYTGDDTVDGIYTKGKTSDDDEKLWSALKNPFGSSDINAVAFGGDKFVAGGHDGKIATSTDGKNWSSVPNSPFGKSGINGLAHGGGKFAAVGADGKIATSSDGTNWTPASGNPFGTSGINGIAFGGGKFAAVGADGKIASSADGTNWTPASGSPFGTSGINGIAFGNGKFAAVGVDGKMAYSADGISWTPIPVSPFGDSDINAIAFDNGKFIAGGIDGKMAFSVDGINWTLITGNPFGINGIINAITFGNGKFFAVGSGGRMAYSSDGINWTSIFNGAFGSHAIKAIVFANGKFIAVGRNGKMAYQADDDDGGDEGTVSTGVIPDEIYGDFTGEMPVYSGTTPPDITGQYLANKLTLTGCNDSAFKIGDIFTNLYIAFIKGADGKLSYRESSSSSEAGSDDVVVEIVGSNNNFTAYFVTTGVSNGISTRMSTLISGTLTSSGIRNFYYSFVMLEKGPDPSKLLVSVNTYRIFKDGDGEASRYTWRK